MIKVVPGKSVECKPLGTSQTSESRAMINSSLKWHRDRRRCVKQDGGLSYRALLLLLLVSGVCWSSASDADYFSGSEGCQVTRQVGSDGSVVDCRLRSINLGLGAHWTQVNPVSKQEAQVLTIVCNDPTAFPTVLTAAIFANYTQLETLSLDSCRLSEILDGGFQGLRGLRHLRIETHNSEWPGTSLALANNVLDDVPLLEKLDLAFNDMRSLPESVCLLRSLVELNVTNNRLQDLAFVAAETGCLSNLRVLDVSYNRINHLPAGGLSSLSQLQVLNLDSNGMTSVHDSSLYSLSLLRVLNLANNRITSLPPGLFAHSRQLAELYASGNGLSVVAPGIFSGLANLLVLDLSDNQLTSSAFSPTIFAGLQKLAVLSLHDNRISRLEASIFSDLVSLQIIRLDGNALETLPDGLFTSLRNLHTLILSRNRLTHIDGKLLRGLGSLALLALDNNIISEIHQEAFDNTTGLRDLNLSANNLPAVPTSLRALNQLQSLDLGENHISHFDYSLLDNAKELYSLRLLDNSIGNITRNTFSQMRSLKILNLSKNQIFSIEEGSFANNPELQAVRLDANHLQTVGQVFQNLPNLEWLNISDNRLIHFDYALIPKSLKWLDIHGNQIEELGNYFQLDDKLSLQTLDASFNRISELTASMLPDSLQIVSLNDNLISQVQPYTFFRKDNLSRVDLYANHISELDQNALRISPVTDKRPLPEFYIGGNPFQCDCTMEWIQRINTPDHLRQHPRVMDLESIYCRLLHSRQKTYVPLVEASASSFLCTYETHCFALCHCCDFDACDCKMTCPTNCTCFHDQSWSANIVECSNSNHTVLPEKIPMDVTELYLDGNNFVELTSHKFIGRKNLRVLYLNSSGVEVINNRTFNGLRGLHVLHLQDNLIHELRGFEFSDLDALRELYLQNNAIRTVRNSTFFSLKHLEIIRLDGNRLLELALGSVLTSSPYLVQVTLAGNPWNCDCRFLNEMRPALLIAGPKVSDAADLVCISNDQDVATTATLPILPAATTTTNQAAGQSDALLCISATPSATTIVQDHVIQDYLPLLVATLVAFVVLSLIVVLAFVFRYEIRVWCYSRYGFRLWAKRDSVLDQSKLFDAFVTYSAKDEAFVQQMLATNLEYGSPSYKLCLQHRDCPTSGVYLMETIAQAVDASKRTIMVISQNFLKSEWGRFDYKSALHQIFKNRRKCLIVVLVTDIPHKDLDPDLKLYLKTNTFLRWGERSFWEKLRFAMPDIPRQKRSASHRTRPCTVNIPTCSVTLNMTT